jgi:site-specific DNA-methyltransferase (cytosine-N4-specific)
MKNNAIRDFIQKAKKAYPFFLANFNNFYLKKCDSIKELTTLESNSIDVTITSPPYGDNKTTVPYGQFSTLALYWIDSSDLIMEGWELENYSIIDSNSMGGKRKIIKCNTLEHELFSKYTIGIGSKKKVKVENFLFDYLLFLKLVSRVTKNYIILTLGNRTVDKVKIDLTGITVEYLKYHGFNNENLMEREIPSKRIPSVTSSVDNSPVESMNSEYVLIFKKIADVNTSNY